jgi:putative restriction endonuclease
MPSLDPLLMVKAISDAFDESDASALLLSPVRGNPKRFVIQYGRSSIELWIYIWTLTHGGGAARPANEYRIQLTGVRPPLAENSNGPTLLVGYEPNTGCFAGFDLDKHRTFSTQSPSIQIPITTLHDALQYGFSFTTKGNDEIAIGIRPDQFLAYCLDSRALHREGANAQMVNLLTKAASLAPILDAEIQQAPPERQRIIAEVSRLSRDSNFRHKVIAAYDRRCAVTRMQLRLVDAAHILPVGVEGSTDDITNGICLSPTYHRAFDRALIYLDEDLRMQINPEKELELIQTGQAGGLADFKSYLGMRVHLPADRTLWPKIAHIRSANNFRNVASSSS